MKLLSCVFYLYRATSDLLQDFFDIAGDMQELQQSDLSGPGAVEYSFDGRGDIQAAEHDSRVTRLVHSSTNTSLILKSLSRAAAEMSMSLPLTQPMTRLRIDSRNRTT